MATPRIRINRAEKRRMLNAEGRYSGVETMLVQRMQSVLAKAQANAPVKTGAYYDGLEIRVDRTDRVAVRVAATAPHSHLVEARHGVLARALDEAGGD